MFCSGRRAVVAGKQSENVRMRNGWKNANLPWLQTNDWEVNDLVVKVTLIFPPVS